METIQEQKKTNSNEDAGIVTLAATSNVPYENSEQLSFVLENNMYSSTTTKLDAVVYLQFNSNNPSVDLYISNPSYETDIYCFLKHIDSKKDENSMVFKLDIGYLKNCKVKIKTSHLVTSGTILY